MRRQQRDLQLGNDRGRIGSNASPPGKSLSRLFGQHSHAVDQPNQAAVLRQTQKRRQTFAIGQIVGQSPRGKDRRIERRQLIAQSRRSGMQNDIKYPTTQFLKTHALHPASAGRVGGVLMCQLDQLVCLGRCAVDHHQLGRATRQKR